ncbi:MAG: hypothetical protein ACRCSE_05965 [Vibrio sp.]
MKNIELYGLGKVNAEFQKRGAEIQSKRSLGMTEEESTARALAWNAFIEDDIKVDTKLELLRPAIERYYAVAVEAFREDNLSFQCSVSEFEKHFYDETYVIAKAVTNKSVQLAVRICQVAFMALVVYGLLTIIN